MKASELIERLQQLVEGYGDHSVFYDYDCVVSKCEYNGADRTFEVSDDEDDNNYDE